jgi:hypothetical protein
MREALGKGYQKPTLDSFCVALIREEDKLIQLGVISTVSTSNKALVSQQKDKPQVSQEATYSLQQQAT